MPSVCVLLPVFNGGAYLREAVTSVLAQTYTGFTLLAIDDGSTDESLHLLTSFTDARIQVLENTTNKGLIYTLNRGLEYAIHHGFTYIVRMDADDICLPQRIEKQVAFMEANSAVGFCGSWVEEFTKEGKSKISQRNEGHEKIVAELFFQNTIWHPSVIIRTSALQAHGIRYEANFLHAEDYAIWCRLAAVSKVANMGEVLLRYRVHDKNVSLLYGEQQRQTAVAINIMNLQQQLLDQPNSKPTKAQKEDIKNRYEHLLHKIASDAQRITKSEIQVLRDMLKINQQLGVYHPPFFAQALADFLLQYWSLWCRKYTAHTFVLLFVYGRFFSLLWPRKRQVITAAKCLSGWRARR